MENEDTFTKQLVLAQSDLKAFITTILPFHADAVADLVQETDLALLAARGRYDASKPFVPWAIAFARNKVKEFLHDRTRERVLFSSDVIDRLSEIYPDPHGAAFNPNDEREGLLNRMRACRAKLREQDRLLLSLFYEHGLSIREIAGKLDRREEGVRVTLSGIRGKLGDCIRRFCRLSNEEFERLAAGALGKVVDAAIEGRQPSRSLLRAADAEARALDDAALLRYADQLRVDAILNDEAGRSARSPRRRPWAKLLAAAAGLAILLGGAFAYAYYTQSSGSGSGASRLAAVSETAPALSAAVPAASATPSTVSVREAAGVAAVVPAAAQPTTTQGATTTVKTAQKTVAVAVSAIVALSTSPSSGEVFSEETFLDTRDCAIDYSSNCPLDTAADLGTLYSFH